ncbi:MAG: 3-keto-5-aminohexanoate cleavage protein [Thermoleophilia bacterium]|nr:3-keto-5-aminohexanoate cleavage protein [Thermoleophilia bacterium]
MEKLIITVATTGAMTTKENTPYLPTQPEQIAEEVYGAYQAGAVICHVHVRTKDDKPTMALDRFEETVGLIREKCPDIIINMTSSGGLGFTDEERILPIVKLKPDMATFDAGSMNFYKGVFINSPEFLEKLGKACIENGVKPEVEVFDAGMVWNAVRFIKEGVLVPPVHFQCCMHVHGGMEGTAKNLVHLVDLLPAGSTWSAFGCGPTANLIMSMAINMGGHVRVGMEDNVYLKKGVLAKHNYEFVQKVVRLADEFGREIADVDDARRILSLPPRQKAS